MSLLSITVQIFNNLTSEKKKTNILFVRITPFTFPFTVRLHVPDKIAPICQLK